MPPKRLIGLITFALVAYATPRAVAQQPTSENPFSSAAPSAKEHSAGKEAEAWVIAIKKRFKDVLFATGDEPTTRPPADDLTPLPAEERRAYFRQNEDQAFKILSKAMPHIRIPEPVLAPQMARYLNEEFGAANLPYRVKFLLSEDGDAAQRSRRLWNLFFIALQDDWKSQEELRKSSLSKALQQGSLWDIMVAVRSSMQPPADSVVFSSGLILISPGG
jgi:hypothetical protein